MEMLKRIQQLSDDLKKNPWVSDVRYEPSWEGMQFVFRSIQRDYGIAVNTILRGLLLETDGVQLEWKFSPSEKQEFQSDTIPGGELNLPPAASIYSVPTKDKLWFDDMNHLVPKGQLIRPSVRSLGY
jgi:hypothetical protein